MHKQTICLTSDAIGVMRTEHNKDGSFNVWMSRDEYQQSPAQPARGIGRSPLG